MGFCVGEVEGDGEGNALTVLIVKGYPQLLYLDAGSIVITFGTVQNWIFKLTAHQIMKYFKTLCG
jgi:hypothetical protein